jgi:hypothetical protein
MFVGQQFLQNVLGYSTLDAGLAILPAAVFMVLIAPRSAKLVEARGSRVTLLGRLRRLPVGLPDHGACLEGGHLLLEGGARLRVRRDRRRLRRHAGIAFPHRLRACPPRWDGLRNCRPAARSGRGDHAIDPRRAAHGGLRRGRGGGDRGCAQRRQDQRQRPERAHQVVLQRRRHRLALLLSSHHFRLIAGVRSAVRVGRRPFPGRRPGTPRLSPLPSPWRRAHRHPASGRRGSASTSP